MAMIYPHVREDLIAAIEAEMMGPGSEQLITSGNSDDSNYEMITENPLQRYSVGILYAQKTRRDPEDENTEEQHISDSAEADEFLDAAIITANQYYPSSIGMSFYASGTNPAMLVQVTAGRYRRLEWFECRVHVGDLPHPLANNPKFLKHVFLEDGWLHLRGKMDSEIRSLLIELHAESQEWKDAVHKLYNLQMYGWQRIPLDGDPIRIPIPDVSSNGPTGWEKPVCEGLRLACVRRPNSQSNSTLFTLALINDFEERAQKDAEQAFFQIGFRVSPEDPSIRFLDYERPSIIDDPEEQSLALLYRNRKVFGVGHGCAVSWNNNGTILETKIIPSYEVPASRFDVDELSSVATILSMRNLSDLTRLPKNEVIRGLYCFVEIYVEWIDRKSGDAANLDNHTRTTAEQHLDECRECAHRLRQGVDLLNQDDEIFAAFQLANRAMLMQRAHTKLQDKTRYPGEGSVDWPDYTQFPPKDASWRPFQLAFLLLNICSISNPKSHDRNMVDLIWFPTGGGKTEAYLGVSAFTIFLRRLRYPKTGAGTTIIMRYTLRLLTAQQFQRASTLICACELIRREMPTLLGSDPVTLGLWIGSSSTPNTLDSARNMVDELMANTRKDSPFQILTCPWCGTKLTKDDGNGQQKGNWGYRVERRPARLKIFCTEISCAFSNELPIIVVDEDIYNHPPTFLFGTVDKFALLPWKQETNNIFGLSTNVLSPELIIQDELHLISGPLGTMVGLYETVVDLLCAAKGVPPKIIASTATICRADDQVKALYNREVSVFPPSGIEAEDSFFAREAALSEKPGRVYVGLMAAGKTMTTTQVRLMASLLQHVSDMDYGVEAKDPYWTLVCYFNTIRELGKCSTLASDDIKDQVRRIAYRKGTKVREYYEVHELTSRRKSQDISAMLSKMRISYPDHDAIHILLASSMMSVGIDIDRLGLMTVVSQPKTSSEYIQATSRIGRKYPGLVVALYDGARPRDRSHYERFTSFHQALYRYVEPTSVTPFAGPSRDRALHAVLVALVRHNVEGLADDNQAGSFTTDYPGVRQVTEAIVGRANSIMPEESKSTAADLERLINEWANTAKGNQSLTYSNPHRCHLLYPADRLNDNLWPTMQSMRNVDASCNIRVYNENPGGDLNDRQAE